VGRGPGAAPDAAAVLDAAPGRRRAGPALVAVRGAGLRAGGARRLDRPRPRAGARLAPGRRRERPGRHADPRPGPGRTDARAGRPGGGRGRRLGSRLGRRPALAGRPPAGLPGPGRLGRAVLGRPHGPGGRVPGRGDVVLSADRRPARRPGAGDGPGGRRPRPGWGRHAGRWGPSWRSPSG
jgi:hypothetical protein